MNGPQADAGSGKRSEAVRDILGGAATHKSCGRTGDLVVPARWHGGPPLPKGANSYGMAGAALRATGASCGFSRGLAAWAAWRWDVRQPVDSQKGRRSGASATRLRSGTKGQGKSEQKRLAA